MPAHRGWPRSFAPSVIGFAAVLRNLSELHGLVRGLGRRRGSWSWCWLLVGTVLSGGILDRYARQRALRAHGFLPRAAGSPAGCCV